LHGKEFNFDELLRLGNPGNVFRTTLAHSMAEQGYAFSLDQLLALGNPEDDFGVTIAHWMAARGHIFSLNDLLMLGNPKIRPNPWMLDWWSSADFTSQLIDSGSPAERIGASVAHIMAREGHEFSVEEILTLGNPVDLKGASLVDWMAWRGTHLAPEDLARLQQVSEETATAD
jgi:hypothetical protein